MPRSKQGAKANRRERHLAYTAELKARKRLRKQRAAVFAHLPGQQPTIANEPTVVLAVNVGSLREMSVPVLRDMARGRGCDVRSRHRKAELVAMIEQASA